jgi:hypothetical protein
MDLDALLAGCLSNDNQVRGAAAARRSCARPRSQAQAQAAACRDAL